MRGVQSIRSKFCLLAAVSGLAWGSPALAATGDPVSIGDGITLDPILAARLRYEAVDQDSIAASADAVTARVRAGLELKLSGFAILAETESTLGIVNDYNDTIPGNGIEPFPVVADPQNIELNRLQVSYMDKGTGATIGRQRINLDNQRFVGAVGWRQNEQTFDALRGQAKFGQFSLDATYSISQRTVFGVDSPSEHFDGDLVFLNGGVDTKHVDGKVFAYLFDYDTRLAFSSQTYGFLVTGELPIAGFGKLTGLASYASQNDMGGNPADYSADYINAQLGLGFSGFTVTAGYEELGSDGGVAAFQTPLATLHAFNGWADLFLTTPARGQRDYYGGISKTVAVPALPGLKFDLIYHEFDSDFGGIEYGSEWDASLGFRLGPVNLLAKYANYNSSGFAFDTEKFWLQAEIGF